MTWLSLDPSSTRTGYALWSGSILIEAGTLRPDRTRDDVFTRVDTMVRELRALVDEMRSGKIETAVIEVPSGRRGRGSEGGATGHLALYGVAVGAIRETCRGLGIEVVATSEREWTRGRPARRRQSIVARTVVGYDASKDTGADVSDAIGIGQWWISQRMVNAARAAGGDMAIVKTTADGLMRLQQARDTAALQPPARPVKKRPVNPTQPPPPPPPPGIGKRKRGAR